MVATVQIGEKNGTPGTFTDKTSGTVRFCNADSATPGTNNPMVIPGTGSDYSYEKWLRLKITAVPDTQITNPKFYSTDGVNSFGTGVNLYAKAVTTYATPAEATATAGYTDAFSYTSGSALTLGTGTYTATGEFADHTVMMMTVASTASQGSLTPESMTWSYDEI
jgi:hypothetical protein